MWMMVKEGGWGAMIAMLLSSLGVILGIVSLALLPIARKVGHALGVVTLVLAFLAPAVGVLGMASGRRATERALSGGSVGPGMKARILHEGYRESQSSALVGFYGGLLPLLLGATAAFVGARRKPDEVPSALRWALAGAGSGVALLTSVGAFAASKGPIPPEVSADDASLLDARDQIDTDPGNGCQRLEETLNESYWHPANKREWPRRFNPDPHVAVPDFDAVATSCARRRMGFPDILSSPLLVDDDLKKSIEATPSPTSPWQNGDIGDSFFGNDAGIVGLGVFASDAGGGRSEGIGLGNIGTIGGGGPHPSATTTVKAPSIRQGATLVSGRLPPEVIQRIVRQNFGRFRLCYENGLRSNPALEGTVRVKFVIGTDGTVSSTSDGGSDLPDASVVSCVVRGFSNLSFPQPEGGIVVVTYPLIFKAGS